MKSKDYIFGSACIVLFLSLSYGNHRYGEVIFHDIRTSHELGDEVREDFTVVYRGSQINSSGSYGIINPDNTTYTLGQRVTGSRGF